ncbi:hypothetical protein [Pseudoflavonifractor phocaeensis]|uniref:hypothetical protein n=1 Tax=Pseudoflavonifractor phocaeensis TaxID=1870988 RepID=UPI00210E57A3|nr:hypothetical protein [Pseudoflavonifractor phocaeensis]MCQ4864646.1 hypothetical protein [Pseudoflavonifractor phocaeensis]
MKRTILTALRWSAWLVVLSVIVTQVSGNVLEDTLTLGMFVIAALLYMISLVLERKYKW